MEISAINSRYNVPTKAQYDAYATQNTMNYPAYVEEETPKTSSMLGATLLGIIGIAGIGYGIYKHKDCKALAKKIVEKDTTIAEKTKEIAEKTKELTESNEAHEVTKKALQDSQKEVQELKEAAKKKFSWSSLKFWKNWGKKKA